MVQATNLHLVCVEDGVFKILENSIPSEIGCPHTIVRDPEGLLAYLESAEKKPSAIVVYDASIEPCRVLDTPLQNHLRDYFSRVMGTNLSAKSDMPGVVIARMLKAEQSPYRDIPVVVLGVFEKAHYLAAGADVVLSSDEMTCRAGQIRDTVARALGQKITGCSFRDLGAFFPQ